MPSIWRRALDLFGTKPSLPRRKPGAQTEPPAIGEFSEGSRHAPPGLEAGAARRRLSLRQPAAQHINALMQAAGPTVNARARWLCRNNGYAKAAMRSWSSATVGSGIKPSSLVEDETLREGIHSAWRDWTDYCPTCFEGIASRHDQSEHSGSTATGTRPKRSLSRSPTAWSCAGKYRGRPAPNRRYGATGSP